LSANQIFPLFYGSGTDFVKIAKTGKNCIILPLSFGKDVLDVF
jgi:hypothetical protein